jgi:phosphoribosylglycinamide formyltransferase-1
MVKKLRTAVLISGRGSNLKALIEACAAKDFPAEIVLVISNVADAGGLAHAHAARIPTAIVPHKDYPTPEALDEAMNAHLRQAEADFICLAGFMRILSDGFVRRWDGRMINIHPSLLPNFKGTQVHERVIAAGVKTTGCTVHYVVPELDSGPVILQAEVPVLPGDTPDTLAARVLEQEHELYPRALRRIAEGRVRLENGRVVFAG